MQKANAIVLSDSSCGAELVLRASLRGCDHLGTAARSSYVRVNAQADRQLCVASGELKEVTAMQQRF